MRYGLRAKKGTEPGEVAKLVGVSVSQRQREPTREDNEHSFSQRVPIPQTVEGMFLPLQQGSILSWNMDCVRVAKDSWRF